MINEQNSVNSTFDINPFWEGNEYFSSLNQVSTISETATKVKEVMILDYCNLTVEFGLRNNWWWQHAYWQIYVNWVAVWQLHDTTSFATTIYTEIIRWLNKWDLLQIYIHTGNSIELARASSFVWRYVIWNRLYGTVLLD